MYYGVDYYPEHWPAKRWSVDLDEMVELGFNMIRIAEFAWTRFEPRRDAYDFSWTDEIMRLCADRGITVMLGLPVRNVPPWLIAEDPEMAVLEYGGEREAFGTRYTTCLNSPSLRERALTLTRTMGERYRDDATVVAWHLDNEYGDASMCYCPRCRSRFIEWLKGRYESVSELNDAWGLVFWSLELSDWDEIWLPAKTNRFQHNPSLLQEYRRFSSDTTVDFVAEQCAALRSVAPDAVITTNLQSMTRYHTDYHRMCRDLDVVSTNYYPPNSYTSADLDIMRGIKQQPFWVVEQRSGAQGFTHRSFPSPAPGETRMYTFQSIGHGADAVLYFRWRPTPYGQEQFHGGLLKPDGLSTRITQEIAEAGDEVNEVFRRVKGTTVENEVAVLMSYDTRWALEFYPPHPGIGYRDLFLQYYRALERRQVPMDVVHPQSDLSGYKLVVVPMLYLMEQADVENLDAFVRNGGTVVVSTATGTKDHFANLYPSGMASGLSQMLGIQLEELIAIPDDAPQSIAFLSDGSYGARHWVDRITLVDAEALGTFASDWYAQSPAVTRNEHGRGRAYYVASVAEDGLLDALLAEVLREAGVRRLLDGEPGVEVVRRVGADSEFLFVMNRTGEPKEVTVPDALECVVGIRPQNAKLALGPFDVSVFQGPRSRDAR